MFSPDSEFHREMDHEHATAAMRNAVRDYVDAKLWQFKNTLFRLMFLSGAGVSIVHDLTKPPPQIEAAVVRATVFLAGWIASHAWQSWNERETSNALNRAAENDPDALQEHVALEWLSGSSDKRQALRQLASDHTPELVMVLHEGSEENF